LVEAAQGLRPPMIRAADRAHQWQNPISAEKMPVRVWGYLTGICGSDS